MCSNLSPPCAPLSLSDHCYFPYKFLVNIFSRKTYVKLHKGSGSYRKVNATFISISKKSLLHILRRRHVSRRLDAADFAAVVFFAVADDFDRHEFSDLFYLYIIELHCFAFFNNYIYQRK